MITKFNAIPDKQFLAVKWNGTNISAVTEFCRFCYYSNGDMFTTIRGTAIRLDKNDWIIHITDDEYIILNDKAANYLFKEVENSVG